MPLTRQPEDGYISFLALRRKERLMSAYEILMVVLTIAILVVEVIKLVVSNKDNNKK